MAQKVAYCMTEILSSSIRSELVSDSYQVKIKVVKRADWSLSSLTVCPPVREDHPRALDSLL